MNFEKLVKHILNHGVVIISFPDTSEGLGRLVIIVNLSNFCILNCFM